MTATADHLKPLPTRRGLRSWRGSGPGFKLPSWGLCVLLALLVVPPIVMLVRTSLVDMEAPDSGYSLINYAKLFADPHLYASAANSVVFAALATLLSLLIGGTMAWYTPANSQIASKMAAALT